MSALNPRPNLRTAATWLARLLALFLVALTTVPSAAPAVSAAQVAPGRAAVAYRWPIPAPREILRPFSVGPHPWSAGHRGVDLALPDPHHPRVYAAADGQVTFAGTVVGRTVVSIMHADGVRTTYQPVEPAVKKGDYVRAGQLIGTVNHLHSPCPRLCVHWGAKTGKKTYLNPLSLVITEVILLPDIPASASQMPAHISSRPRVSLLKDGFEPLGVNVGITLSGGERRMSQNLLHTAQIRAPCQQVGSCRVA